MDPHVDASEHALSSRWRVGQCQRDSWLVHRHSRTRTMVCLHLAHSADLVSVPVRIVHGAGHVADHILE